MSALSIKGLQGQNLKIPAMIQSLENRTLLSAATTSVALAQSLLSSASGQAVTLTATLTTKSGKPAGNVTFKSGSTTLGTAALNSAEKATLTLGSLSVGTDSLTAAYAGSSSFAASTSSAVSHKVNAAGTTTALSVSASSALIGKPVTFSVNVADVAPGVGTPGGTVTLYDGKTAIASQALSGGKASVALSTLYTGKHSITAVYSGSTAAVASTSAAVSVTITLPKMTTLTGGLQEGTVTSGTGNGAVDGQSLEVNYIGYLTNGTVFDTSLATGRTPFSFTLGAGQVIAGWDEGLVGIKVGEQRVLVIPPALGYGSTTQSSIPANSTLVFVVQLLAFNQPKLVVTGVKGVSITNNESPTTANGTNFQTVKVGKSSSIETFTLSNTGTAALSFTSSPWVILSGTDAADFTLVQPTISGNQAIFTIIFTPKKTGTRTATITIPTNDPTYPNFSFTIEGTGD